MKRAFRKVSLRALAVVKVHHQPFSSSSLKLAHIPDVAHSAVIKRVVGRPPNSESKENALGPICGSQAVSRTRRSGFFMLTGTVGLNVEQNSAASRPVTAASFSVKAKARFAVQRPEW